MGMQIKCWKTQLLNLKRKHSPAPNVTNAEETKTDQMNSKQGDCKNRNDIMARKNNRVGWQVSA